MLKFAHAAEIAAYHAYEGHWRSVSNQIERQYIQKIAFDELKHIGTLRAILATMNAKPNKFLDMCGKTVGEMVGFACYHTGWRLPMIVAGLMEKIGTSSYRKIAYEAAENGKRLLALQLMKMADNEDEHDAYFKELRNTK